MTRVQNVVVAIIFFFTPSISRADSLLCIKEDGHRFESSSKSAQAILSNKGTSLVVTINGKKSYQTRVRNILLSHGDAWISDDGRRIIWNLSGGFYGHLLSGQKRFRSKTLKDPALLFFVDGKVLKSYSLEELLGRVDFVMETASHSIWLSYKSGRSNYGANPVVSADGKYFELETTSFRHYKMDTSTGSMVVAEDSKVWQDATLIGCVKLESSGTNWIASQAGTPIKTPAGQKFPIIVFDPTNTYNAGIRSIALKSDCGRWITVAPESELCWVCALNKLGSIPHSEPAQRPLQHF